MIVTSARRAVSALCAMFFGIAMLAAPSAIAAPTNCSASQVTVVVSGAGQGCASAGTSGMSALTEAGFSVTEVSSQPGMICQINGAPADADCSKVPPPDSYWAYYHAPLGGEWAYSNVGAASYTTKAGMVEGWAFGSGANPGAVPDAPVAAEEEPSDVADAPTNTGGDAEDDSPVGAGNAQKPREDRQGSSPASTSARDGRSSDSKTSGTESSKASESSKPSESSTEATESDAPHKSRNAAAGEEDAAESQATSKEDKNNWLPVVGVIALIIALAAAGFYVARRRSTRE